jgi:hypothetical protein
LRNNKPFIIEDIVEDIEEVWTVKGGIYREVLLNYFDSIKHLTFMPTIFQKWRKKILISSF